MKLKFFALALSILFIVEVNAQTTITTGTIISPFCSGSTVLIPYTVIGPVNNGNVFTAQLSNSSGLFTSPTNIGTLNSQSDGTITGTIPTGISGNSYKIRVVSSNPVVTGSSSSNLTVHTYNKIIFTEQMGTVGGTISISTHESANGFDNDAFTMSGTADIRNTTPSSGYSGASGNANVFLQSSLGQDFQISGINTTGQTGLTLSFGIHKNATGNNDTPVLEVSSNGITYTSLNYTLPTGSGTSSWHYRTATGIIPATSNLRIRFRQAGITPTIQYRIDDIRLTADDLNAGITISNPSYVCNGSSVTLSATTAVSYLWSNGSGSQSNNTSTPGAYNCILTSSNGCTLSSNTISVNDSTPIQYTVIGGGTFCSSPGTGLQIQLSSSQLNYNYQLFLNTSTPIGSPMAGTGSNIDFGFQTASGNYTVTATLINSSCTRSMLNSVTIAETIATMYYEDLDGDNYGNPLSGVLLCYPPVEYVADNTDCNDTVVTINPSAIEICNNVDDDCDNYIDEGCGTPIYCIGPGSSYTPPSGPSYVNQFSPFPTVTAAVAFLNSFSATQHVIFEIQNNYTGAGETVPITITYQGNASATAVFRPRSDVSSLLMIYGSGGGTTTGLIQLDGADYITFDGSPGGVLGATSNLRVRNTLNSGNANANFLLKNDATNNIINAITIEAGASSNHAIYLGNSAGPIGNDNNVIQNNKISGRSDAIVPLPVIAFHAVGTATGSAANSGISFINNHIINISDGVYVELNGNAGNWNISNNHFYFTDNLAPSKFSGVIDVTSIGNLTATINSNYIGGTAPFAGGAQLNELSSTIATSCINFRVLAGTNKSTISGNIIQNMNRSTTGSCAFTAINVLEGIVDVTNNIIGNASQSNDISFGPNTVILCRGIIYSSSQNLLSIQLTGNEINNFTTQNSGFSSFKGIDYSNVFGSGIGATISDNKIKAINFSGGNGLTCLLAAASETSLSPLIISNNIIEQINLNNTSTSIFKGIHTTRGNIEITGNRIGSWMASNDITINSSNSHYGIHAEYLTSGNGLITSDTISNILLNNTSAINKFTAILANLKGSTLNQVSENVINNIYSASTISGSEGNTNNYILAGIYHASLGTSGLSVTNNIITSMHATTTSNTANPAISGIIISRDNSGPLVVSGNTIHSFTNAATNTSSFPIITGIKFSGIQNNNSTFSNNMISLNNDLNQNDVNIYGIYDAISNGQAGNLKNYFFNSVHIQGNSLGSSRSSAFWQNATSSKLSLKNNIFSNIRTGSGNHFAIVHESGNSSAWNSTTSDFNDLYSANSSSLGAYPLASLKSFATWKITSGGDINSKNIPANFIAPQNLHLDPVNNCDLENAGTPVAGINIDYDLQIRNISTPDIGADEFTAVCATLVNLKTFIEGYYNGTGTMRKAIDPLAASNDCDTLILQLAQSTAPFTILFSDTAILQTNGTAEFYFPNAISGNNYYLVLKHRNALKVWSGASQSITNGFTYDFTTAANKAFGSNQKLLETGIFGIYSGDVNQDGAINTIDYSLIENTTSNMYNGYYPSDLTGDHQIESSDFSLIENNAQLLLNVAQP